MYIQWNLTTMYGQGTGKTCFLLTITRFLYLEVLYHILGHYWVGEYCLLCYRVCYIEVHRPNSLSLD